MRLPRRPRRVPRRPPAAGPPGVATFAPTTRNAAAGARSTAPAVPAAASGSRTCTLLAARERAAPRRSGPSPPAFVLVGPDDPLNQRVADDIVLVEVYNPNPFDALDPVDRVGQLAPPGRRPG